MFKRFVLFSLLFSLTACGGGESQYNYEVDHTYGVFLGADGSAKARISAYNKVAIDIDEFESSDITYLKNKGCEIYAYLSIGSLENYRDYYEEYKDYAFFEYTNWPDEKWIDVSQESWQNLLVSEANRFKGLGASGLFMDNFDVYYIASEEYKGDKVSAESIYNACITILNALSALNLKLIINSGSTLLERFYEEKRYDLLNKIDVYCQESVFSNILDYDKDVFGRQEKDEHDYYLSVISFMKKYSEILLLEYTTDEELKNEITTYCKNNSYHYYVSSHVNLI